MTGPRVDIPPMRRVLSLDEFEAAQQLPSVKPLQSAPSDSGLSRILSPDEFEHAQTLPGSALKQWKIPALPNMAGRDVTAGMNPNTPKGKGTKIDGVLGAVLRQAVDPVLEHPLANVAMGAGMVTPGVNVVLGAYMGGEMLTNVAQYGYQKYLETHATPEQRKEMEADPERVSGESAAVQAAMLGLAPLIHVGMKSFKGPGYGDGMFSGAGEAAASTAPKFRAGFDDGQKAGRLAASLEDGADLTATRQRFGVTAERPKGFEPTATSSRAGAGAKPVEGMIVPEPVKAGKVTPVETVDPAAPLAADAALSNTITDGIAELRRQDAERASRIRRRPKPSEAQPFFETEQGAQTLGATAARHGLPEDANPYHAETMPAQAAAWSEGHGAATESFPDGFSMGGSLADNRIPADYQVPKVPGFEPHVVPDGVTHETIALADALKPSRFRRHSESDLVEAALDTQNRIEQAQAHAAQAPLRGNVGAAAEADFENRATNFAQSYEASSKAADRELTRATSQMQQIEREAALRGITGDDLANRINDAKAARLERQGQAEDASLTFAFGEEPAAGVSGGSLTPVDGTGETRTRGLSRGVQEKALRNKLDAVVGQLPEYQQVNMADQSAMAVQLLSENPSLARSVALGEAPAPHGLLPESVFVAVENAAIEAGDVATIRELATGKLTSEATTMGQRIRALAERDPDSPVAAIKKVVDIRMGGAKDAPKETLATVEAIRAKLKDVQVTPEAWSKFVDSLRCS